MKRNVYDFDGTIYDGDSTAHFYRYCAARQPRMLLDLPAVGVAFLGMSLGLVEKTRAKQRLYRFLTFLPDVNAYVADFWATHRQRIKPWYLAQKCRDDLIISASPDFLLAPICAELGVALLASRVDPHTGETEGLNCHDVEKVRRMRERDPDSEVAQFYSDSLSDLPLAELAQEAFLVKGNEFFDFTRDKRRKK
ncbi:MAG: haloacid dehalogenase-like hydrolase [Clostridia bacterium]